MASYVGHCDNKHHVSSNNDSLTIPWSRGSNVNYRPGRKGCLIYRALKCIHAHTMHRGKQGVTNERSVQSIEAGIKRLK
jgi:hypothetical protein